MKKKTIIITAALCVALSACGGQPAQESASPSVVPTATVPAVQTADPTATPTPVAMAEPTAVPTAEPTDTPAPTLAPTPNPAVSIPPSVEPTAPAVETPTPEVTPPPTESTAQPPEPTESLCGLPLAPTPTPEISEPPATTETPTPVESQAPTRPSDEEVLAAYRAAKEVMGWMTDSYNMEGYDDSGLALDHTDQQTLTLTLGNGTEETMVFERITRPGLDSMEALWGYLKSLFSDEIVDDLMAFQVPVFVEGEQGGLYALPSQAQGFQQPGSTLSVLWPDEEAPVSCQIRAVTGGEEEYRESLYQKVGDKWIFTQFEVPNSDKK